GHPDEVRALARDLKLCPIPVVAVFGNHDYHLNQVEDAIRILQEANVVVLDNSSVEITVRGEKVGIAGAKGFGGGFVGACGSDFGEPEMKTFMRHSKNEAKKFEDELAKLTSPYKIGLLHYSPTAQ